MEIDTEAIDNLIKGLDLKKGTELFGANGLVKQLTKRLVEGALEAEMEEHLGYPKGERSEEPKPNPRNGTTTTRVKTEDGKLEIAVPRDRNGTFTPQLGRRGWTASTRRSCRCTPVG